MPTLPVTLPVALGGDMPVRSPDDVRAVLPDFAQGPPDGAPVREAWVAAIEAEQEAWQRVSCYAAAQGDPTRATGIYLDGHLEDRRLARATGETDEAAQARMLTAQPSVTPISITALADSILAARTAKKSQLLEAATDRWFVSDGTATWHSFIGLVDPQYQDRLYDQRTQAHPGGPWVFGDSNGRMFVLRVPVIDSQDGAHMFVMDGSKNEAIYPAGAFIADGSNAAGSEASGLVATFVSTGNTTALELYQSIANSVQQIKGQGVRWILLADPTL